MSRSSSLFATLCLFFTLSSTAHAEDRPLARYYGKALPRSGYDAELSGIRAQFRANPKKQLTPEREMHYRKRLIVERLEKALVAEALLQNKITVTDADVQREIKDRQASFKDEKGYQAWLDANGMQRPDLAAEVKRDLLIKKLIASKINVKAPTRADVERELTQNPDKWGTPEHVRVRQIFIKLPHAATDATINETRRRVTGIYEKAAAADKKAFGQLAAKFNEGPSTDGKGLLGEVRRGRMPRAWDEAVFAAESNEVVGPIATPYGFHIVLVEAHIAPQKAKLGDVEPIVKEQLDRRFHGDAYVELMKRLFDEAKVEILEPGVTIDAAFFAMPDAKPEQRAAQAPAKP